MPICLLSGKDKSLSQKFCDSPGCDITAESGGNGYYVLFMASFQLCSYDTQLIVNKKAHLVHIYYESQKVTIRKKKKLKPIKYIMHMTNLVSAQQN